MKRPLPMLAAVLLAACAAAQDVEPTEPRALASLVRELVSELPDRLPDAGALAVEADAGADPRLVAEVQSRLLAEGFRLGGADAARLRVSTYARGAITTVRVAAGDFVVERGFGRAAWVDRRDDPSRLVVKGAVRNSAEAAEQSARDQLAAALRRRFPALAGSATLDRFLRRHPATTFVAARSVAGRTSYEAWAMVEPPFERLQRAERALTASVRRAPWIRAGLVAACGAVLWFLYVRADFRARGYRTRRLRLVFGTLFAALSFALWSLPL